MWNNLSSRLKIIAVLLLPYALFALAIVLPSHFVDKAEPISFALYDKNGVLIGASVASDGQWRFEKGNVPADFEKAIILFEDKRFYAHHGIDFLSLFRAAASDLKARKIVSGGSTITMQLARLLHKNPKRTFFQKGSGHPYIENYYVKPDLSQQPPSESQVFLYQEYEFLCKPHFAMSLNVKLAKKMFSDKVKSFLSADYTFTKAKNTVYLDGFANEVVINFGVEF